MHRHAGIAQATGHRPPDQTSLPSINAQHRHAGMTSTCIKRKLIAINFLIWTSSNGVSSSVFYRGPLSYDLSNSFIVFIIQYVIYYYILSRKQIESVYFRL